MMLAKVNEWAKNSGLAINPLFVEWSLQK